MNKTIAFVLLFTLAGCITVGPKTKDRITHNHTTNSNKKNVEQFRCTDKLEVELETSSTEDGKLVIARTKKQIRNCVFLRADIAVAKNLNAPRVCDNIMVSGYAKGDTEKSLMDIGGWYMLLEEAQNADPIR